MWSGIIMDTNLIIYTHLHNIYDVRDDYCSSCNRYIDSWHNVTIYRYNLVNDYWSL